MECSEGIWKQKEKKREKETEVSLAAEILGENNGYFSKGLLLVWGTLLEEPKFFDTQDMVHRLLNLLQGVHSPSLSGASCPNYQQPWVHIFSSSPRFIQWPYEAMFSHDLIFFGLIQMSPYKVPAYL